MHIAHVITRLLRAGSEENTVETCRWQVAQGHRVTILHGPGHDPWWDDHLPTDVTRIEVPQMVHPVRPIQDAKAVRALRKIYRVLQPDVIHTHQSKAGILGRIASSAVPNAVVVHGIHIVPFEGVSPLKRVAFVAAERLVARQTDVFIGVSHSVGQAYIDAGIAQPESVNCVRSGMDLARFDAPRLPPDWRDLIGVHHDDHRPFVAVMVAAFEPRKRHVAFLQSFAKIAHTLPDLKILLAGRGPEEARVRSAISELGLADHVVMCGHRPDPEALFALADVSILTSEREGLPRVVIQSIAAGCPPLVQDLPALEEVVTHGQNGWITKAGDMAATVDHLGRLLLDGPRLNRLRQGAKATDLSAWSLEVLGAQTTELYGLSTDQNRPLRDTGWATA